MPECTEFKTLNTASIITFMENSWSGDFYVSAEQACSNCVQDPHLPTLRGLGLVSVFQLPRERVRTRLLVRSLSCCCHYKHERLYARWASRWNRGSQECRAVINSHWIDKRHKPGKSSRQQGTLPEKGVALTSQDEIVVLTVQLLTKSLGHLPKLVSLLLHSSVK